jgi:predicted nucleic acid-binding protein
MSCIPDLEIPLFYLSRAADLARDIDEDDSFFVALTEFFGAYFWTGDGELYRYLGMGKGYQKVLNFADINRRHPSSR